MSNLTFSGFVPAGRSVQYKGITGRTYTFSVNVPSALHIAHGTTLCLENNADLYTVVGVSASDPAATASASTTSSPSAASPTTANTTAIDLPCDLWIHARCSANPTLVKNVTSAEDLFRRGYSIVENPPNSTPFVGPLGISYHFFTSHAFLSSTFGVTQDQRYFIKQSSINTNVRVVGELFGILWVARDDDANVAVPLPNCTNEDALHGLYGVCEPLPANEIASLVRRGGGGEGGAQPNPNQLISTPRRATNTPRRAANNNNSNASASSASVGGVIDNVGGFVTCSGPMGVKVKLDIKASALSPFGVIHNQKLVSCVGIDAGRLCRVVGVANGALYVLFDGDARVTCLRNCDSSEAVKKQFSGGSGGDISSAAASTSTPLRTMSNRAAGASLPALDTASAAASRNNSAASFMDEVMSPASPRIPEKSKQFWTTFGRFEFDTSDKACDVFGFYHGQVVRGTNGSAKGKMYTIVGARLGNLWVLEEGKYRATALVHCTNKAEITKMYGLVPTGTVKDLRPFYEAQAEPPATPMHTPRFRLSQSPQRQNAAGDDDNNSSMGADAMPQLSPRGGGGARSASVELSPPSVRGGSSLSAAASPQLVSSTGPTSNPMTAAGGGSGGLPSLNFNKVQRDNAPLPTVVGASSALMMNALGGGSSSGSPAVIASPAAIALAQPSAREYLKAWALLKMGQRPSASASASPASSLSFHHYYMEDTVRRVSEAFAKLPRARQVWANENRTPDFYEASAQDILQFLYERPSVSAY